MAKDKTPLPALTPLAVAKFARAIAEMGIAGEFVNQMGQATDPDAHATLKEGAAHHAAVAANLADEAHAACVALHEALKPRPVLVRPGLAVPTT